MLRFTDAGAVAGPTAVQIRVTREHLGRIATGVPLPSRDLTRDELRANLQWFTEGLTGPRSRPCDTLVFSGRSLEDHLDVALVKEARALGIQRVVLHIGTAPRAPLVRCGLADQVDGVVITATVGDDLGDLTDHTEVTAVLRLDAQTLPRLGELADAYGQLRTIVTWPFSGSPPPAREVAPAVAELPARVGVKGLPACQLPSSVAADRVWRTANRWHVDADHQQDDARLFFPDLVRFHKEDACRFCSLDERCDGVAVGLVRQGLTGPLVPRSP